MRYHYNPYKKEVIKMAKSKDVKKDVKKKKADPKKQIRLPHHTYND